MKKPFTLRGTTEARRRPGYTGLAGAIALLAAIAAFQACSSSHTRLAAANLVTGQPGAGPGAVSLAWPRGFGFGSPASPADIALVDLDIPPDGRGLPPGSGTVAAGKALYAAQCAACHGKTGTEGPQTVLVAPLPGADPASNGRAVKAIGNYWPYATTLFDYIRRAMPFNAPGSLSDEQVYSLTAFLLEANKIIPAEAVINARTLPRVVMPAQKLFVPDNRRGGREIR